MLLFFQICCVGEAEELRIVDSSGLTRLLRQVQEPLNVIIHDSSAQESGPCRLSNVESAAMQVESRFTEGRCVFPKIAPGTWQISIPVNLSGFKVTVESK